MIASILVVCVGNICRSPVGERLLSKLLPGVHVTSSGIGALVGAAADSVATDVATEHALSLEGHVARAFDPEDAAQKDLILVMEPGHKREIVKQYPHLQGRIMLFDQWTTATGIPDPYQKPRSIHDHAYTQIEAAAVAWATRLNPHKEETL